MTGAHATLAGECAPWPARPALHAALLEAGFSLTAGVHAIRVTECEHFVFQQLDGDVPPAIDADAASVERLIADATRVSTALTAAEIRHRFEVYDGDDRLVAYLHHDWPPG